MNFFSRHDWKAWVMGAALLWACAPGRAQTPCGAAGNVTGARICVAGDDTSTVYIQGALLGTVGYCNWNAGPCNYCLPIPPADYGTSICVAIETQNSAPDVNFTAWDVEVDCSNGTESVITDESSSKSLDYISTGDPTTPPPNDTFGNPWYSLSYTGGGFTSPIATVTGSVWDTPLYSPGNVFVPPLANNSSGDYSSSNSTGALFWRQCAVFPAPVVIPTAPNITVSKSECFGGPGFNGSSMSVTFCLVACNSGAGVTGPVTIYDHWGIGADGTAGFQPVEYGWNNYGNSPVSWGNYVSFSNGNDPQSSGWQGNPAYLYFPDGLSGGGACVTLEWVYQNNSYTNNACQTFVDDASVSWDGGSAGPSAPVTVPIPCDPTPTPSA
ncbi:MAG TPA: hypothetical protein VK859_05230, partial [bacterium]|nr:hypothetical protein [bacterium]